MTITRSQVGQALQVEVVGAPDGPVRVEVELRNPNTGSRTALGPLTGVSRNGRVVLQGPVLDIDATWSDVVVRGFTADGKALGADVNLVE